VNKIFFHRIFLRCVARALPLTGWRLGEAAASTTFVAGDKHSIPHYLFCGVTAAVAPNRSLGAGIFVLMFTY